MKAANRKNKKAGSQKMIALCTIDMTESEFDEILSIMRVGFHCSDSLSQKRNEMFRAVYNYLKNQYYIVDGHYIVSMDQDMILKFCSLLNYYLNNFRGASWVDNFYRRASDIAAQIVEYNATQ